MSNMQICHIHAYAKCKDATSRFHLLLGHRLAVLQDHVHTELREAGLTVTTDVQQFSTKQLEYSGQAFGCVNSVCITQALQSCRLGGKPMAM